MTRVRRKKEIALGILRAQSSLNPICSKNPTNKKKRKWYRMGGPGKIGYSGGKLSPKENERMRGMVAAKSLQALEAIFKFPSGEIWNVLNIRSNEKARMGRNIRISGNERYFFINFKLSKYSGKITF